MPRTREPLRPFPFPAGEKLAPRHDHSRQWRHNLRDGSVSGPIVARVNLAGSSSASQAYKRPGLTFPSGVFVECPSGVIVGSVDIH